MTKVALQAICFHSDPLLNITRIYIVSESSMNKMLFKPTVRSPPL